jgi:hypothetical protein
LLGSGLGFLFCLTTFTGSYTKADNTFWGPFADLTNAIFGGLLFVVRIAALGVSTVVGCLLGLAIGALLSRVASSRARLGIGTAVLTLFGILWAVLLPPRPKLPSPPTFAPRRSSASQAVTPQPSSTVGSQPAQETLPQAAARLLGPWLYPQARMVRYPLAPDDTNYSTFAFYVPDRFPAVVAYYQRIIGGGAVSQTMYRTEGLRPTDGRPATIKVVQETDGVYVRVDLK